VIDNRQGDFNFKRHYADAAPLTLNIPNCRKNKTSIATGHKKIICCNRKDPTFCFFLRNSDDSLTIENQKLNEQYGNKIYFNEAKAQRFDILMIYYKLAGPLSGIPNELFIESSKKSMEQRTIQNGKRFSHTLNNAQGFQIQGERLNWKMFSSTFLFSSVKNTVTIAKNRWFSCVKSCNAQQLIINCILHLSISPSVVSLLSESPSSSFTASSLPPVSPSVVVTSSSLLPVSPSVVVTTPSLRPAFPSSSINAFVQSVSLSSSYTASLNPVSPSVVVTASSLLQVPISLVVIASSPFPVSLSVVVTTPSILPASSSFTACLIAVSLSLVVTASSLVPVCSSMVVTASSLHPASSSSLIASLLRVSPSLVVTAPSFLLQVSPSVVVTTSTSLLPISPVSSYPVTSSPVGSTNQSKCECKLCAFGY
jgi:hypothetical protein